MKNSSTYILIALLVAIISLGIGYAALSNITLTVSGNLGSTMKDANFSVKFTGTPTVSNSTYVTGTVTDNLNAKLEVAAGLLKKSNDTAYGVFQIQNASADLTANISIASCTVSNTTYFTPTCILVNSATSTTALTQPYAVTKGTSVYARVTLKLAKTPIADQTSTLTVTITAAPVEVSHTS